ncbi:MAG: DUF488 domain-containing protein [Capnocytophaga felis]|nr:DUF488 domain-containing protein [Capnocytophaga felis]
MEFYTIGVYNSTEKEFFDKLIEKEIDTFCDIRQRRGVRGAKYAFVNSIQLQQKLSELGIKYVYISNLAPTTEIRELQKKVDFKKKELKRERQMLGELFELEYKNRILNEFNFDSFFEKFDEIGADKIVLFCVEEHPEACHRSIVADKLAIDFGFKISHL